MKEGAIQETAQDKKYRRRWWTLVLLAVSLIVIAIDTTILNVAIPTLQRDLGASASALQWIVAAYVLVFAGLLLTMGSLGDRFGRKRALQTGLVLFGIASLAAAYSQTSGQLIVSRGLMGLGGALIMPSTLSVIIDVFPRDERAKAIGIWAAVAGLGVPLGMVVGGWLLESYWWGSVFLVNMPIVIGVIIAGAIVIPESRDPAPRKLDVVGAALSIGGLSTLVYAIIEAPGRGWLDPVVVSGFVAAAVLSVAFVIYELRSDHPMLDVRLFRSPRLSAGAVAISTSFLVMLGVLFLITQYLQFVVGYSPLETGIRLVPMALGFMVGAGSSSQLLSRLGTKVVVAGGMAVIVAALVVFSTLDIGTAYWVIALALLAIGTGMGATMAPSTDAVMDSVPEANAGVGSALNDVTRNVGGALGVGILGSVMNSAYSSSVASAVTGLPAGAAAAVRNSVGAAAQVAGGLEAPAAEALRVAANAAFIDGLSVAMLTGVAIVVAGILVVLRAMPARATDVEVDDGGRPEFITGELATVPIAIDE